MKTILLKYISILSISISTIISAAINFNIDLNDLDIPNTDYPSIVINGSWNNWSGWGVTLNDDNGDGVFSGSIDLDNGVYEYVIAATGSIDNWSGWGFVVNAPLGSDCDYYPNDEWANYGFVVDGSSDIEQSYCAGSCNAQCENNEGESSLGYVLVWSDEFNDIEIDDTKWNFEIGTGNWGWGNGEYQYYTSRPENAFIEDGKLVIQALNENYAGSNYTSARMTTKNKGDWLYGKIKASIKVPEAGGTWPAFWMMPTNSVYGGWPNSGEMDIMEHYGCNNGEVTSTVHNNIYNWNGGVPPTSYYQNTTSTSEFHEYEMVWMDNELRFFVDGVFIGAYYNEDNGWQQWPYDQEFYIILNLAIGSHFMPCQTEDGLFPQRFEIDYVRVYQLSDILPGDVNLDSELNILDIVAVIQFIIENTGLNDQQYLVADMNQDGAVDVLDIVSIVSVIISLN